MWKRVGIAALAGFALVALLLWVAHSTAARRYVLRQLEPTVAADWLDYNLFSGTARLTSLKVRGTPDFATASEVTMEFSPWSLVSGKPRVTAIRIPQLTIHYVKDAQGRDNLPRFGSSGGPAVEDAFQIALATIGATVQYEDHASQTFANLNGCKVEFRGATPVAIANLRVGCGGSTARYQAKQLAIDSLNLTGSQNKGAFRLASFEIRSGNSNASVSGTVSKSLDLTARAHVETNPLVPVEGIADVTLRITGALPEPAIEILQATAQSPYGQFEAQGALSFRGTTNVTAKFRGVDVRRFARDIAAQASGAVTARFPGLDYHQAVARANVILTPAPGTYPVSGNFVIDAANETYRVTATNARSAGAQLDGQIAIARNGALSGTATVAAPNLMKTPAAIAGSAKADLTFGGTLNAPSVSASATAQQSGLTLQAQVEATQQRASLTEATLTYQNRTVATASGELNPLQLTARADKVPLPLLLEIAALKYPVDGAVTGSFDIAKDSGSGRISIAGITAHEELLGQLDADLTLQGKMLRIANAVLKKPAGGEVRADGSYNLDDAAFRFSAKGNDVLFEGVKLPSGAAHARASFTAAGEGNGSNRRIDATFAATDARWNDTIIGEAQGKATLLNDGLTAELTLPGYNAAAQGRVSLDAPYAAAIDVQLTNTPLKDLPVEGTITAKVSAAGDFDHWQDAEAKGEIAALKLERNGATLTSQAAAAFSLARRTLTLQPLAFTSGQSSLILQGKAPVAEGAPPADVRLEGNLTAADAKTFLTAFGMKAPDDIAGSAQWNLALRGEWRKFLPDGQITIKDAVYGDVRDIAAALTLTPASVDIGSIAAMWNGAPIEGKGSVPLALLAPEGWFAAPPATAPGRVQLNWKNLDLAPLLKATSEKLGGASAGEADIQIKGFGPRDVSGTVTLNPLDLRFGELGFSLEQPARITLQSGVARVEQLNLKGTAGNLSLSGEAGLLAPQPIRLRADGNLDAALLAAFGDQMTAAGNARLHLMITGAASAPALAGFFETTSIDASLPAFNLQAEGIKSRIDFNGDAVTLTSLTGSVNGGTLHGSGSFRLVKGTPEDVRLNLTAANVFLEYPRDLKTAVSAALGLRSTGQQYTLTGDVQILDGSYNENINFDEFLLRGITASAATAEQATDSLLQRLRFNVGLRTASPILVNNNLGKAAINTDLKLLGSYARPGLSGRLTFEEGGELRLNERVYVVERGTVTFVDERRIKPMLDILARTQVGGNEITLQVQGEQGALESKFTSDPPLPEPDIIALLVTGRTLDRLAGSEADITKEQVLSYLTTRVGSELTRRVERTFGLSQVRIQPNLIAAESDPGARLTVGQDIARQVRLTYSMDLAKSNEQLWLGEWDVTRRFRLRGFKDFDNTYRFEFRHDLQFGAVDLGIVEQPRAPIRKIGKIAFEGNFYLNEKELAERAKLTVGRNHDFFAVRKAAARIETRYRSKAFHEARVRAERDIKDSTVDLLFRIREGQQVNFVYEGWTPPSTIRKNVARIWQQGVFDTGRVFAALSELRGALLGEGYLQPTVTHQIRQADERHKQVLFEIHPGAKYERPQIVLEGAAKLSASRIRRAINGHRPRTDLYLRPQRVAQTLARLYRSEGYIEAAVATPRLETDPRNHTARLIVRVQEGARFGIAGARFAGNAAVAESELREALKLEPGETYHQERVDNAIQDLLLRYSSHGYNDAEIEAAFSRGPGTVDLEFRIQEGRQSRLKELVITGNRRTSDSLVRTQSHLRLGDIVNPQKFSDARRNLYGTGAFSLVDIETTEVPGPDDQKLLRATINVRELTPFALKYGAFVDTERGPGVIFDFVTRNYLRSARVAGVRGRYDSQLQEVRGYFSQPLLRRFPIATTSSVFFRREIRKTFIADRTGVSVVQESRFKRHYILNYGYRLEKTHTYDREPDEFLPFDVTLRVAPLQMTLTREDRDDILDATRGSFLSQSMEYAPKALGSELRFLRYYGQYFRYQALTKPSEIPWSSGARRPRVIYAGAVRVGLAKGLDGQDLVPSERFFAGGGNSIRGFEQDLVGPKSALGNPTGGNSLFLMNHELRFPAVSIFEGVAFVDAGNVFRTVSEWRPWDLRASTGLGLRLRTPYFLFRFDYGVNVNRKPGEPFGRFFFSIGQSF